MSPAVLSPIAEVVPFAFSEYIVPALFLVFVATMVGGAIVAVGAQSIIRSVCGLALCCLGLAGLWVTQEARARAGCVARGGLRALTRPAPSVCRALK